MRRVVLCTALLWAAVFLLPGTSHAQVAIAGVVKDASGAVMPGVTVEASSPALIEKTRSVVTDTAGQYKIVDLSPGTYAVSFTLPGFKTVRRAGIVLEGSFTAQVSPELQVGAVEEAAAGQREAAGPVANHTAEALRDNPGIAATDPGAAHHTRVAGLGDSFVAIADFT